MVLSIRKKFVLFVAKIKHKKVLKILSSTNTDIFESISFISIEISFSAELVYFKSGLNLNLNKFIKLLVRIEFLTNVFSMYSILNSNLICFKYFAYALKRLASL